MSSSTLQLFQFESNEIRVVLRDGEPWWVAKDVCAVLEHSNSRMAIASLDEDEKGVSKVYTLGGEQEMQVINEPGLYSLIIRSNKPQAKAFKRWLTHEVIPSIRKTGSYSVHQEPQQQLPPKRDSVDFTEVHKYLSTINDLSIADLLRDKLEEDLYFSLGRQNPKAIAAAKPKEYTIGKVRARELGYSDKQIGNGSALGRFLAKNVPVAYIQRVGKYDVKHYEGADTLDTAIKSYFGMKALVAV